MAQATSGSILGLIRGILDSRSVWNLRYHCFCMG